MTAREAQAVEVPAAATTDRYLTIPEVAKLLRVSSKSVSRWALADPTMPALRIGGVVRFPHDRFLAWLRAREQGRGRPRLVVAKDPGPARKAEAG